MASSQEAVIQDLLFRLVSVYIDRLTNADTQPSSLQTTSRRWQLRNAEDLVQWLKNLHFYLSFSDQVEFKIAVFVFQMNSCSHYGALYPWLTVLNPPYTTSSHNQEALHKLQVICHKNEKNLECSDIKLHSFPCPSSPFCVVRHSRWTSLRHCWRASPKTRYGA